MEGTVYALGERLVIGGNGSRRADKIRSQTTSEQTVETRRNSNQIAQKPVEEASRGCVNVLHRAARVHLDVVLEL